MFTCFLSMKGCHKMLYRLIRRTDKLHSMLKLVVFYLLSGYGVKQAGN